MFTVVNIYTSFSDHMNSRLLYLRLEILITREIMKIFFKILEIKHIILDLHLILNNSASENVFENHRYELSKIVSASSKTLASSKKSPLKPIAREMKTNQC